MGKRENGNECTVLIRESSPFFSDHLFEGVSEHLAPTRFDQFAAKALETKIEHVAPKVQEKKLNMW